MNCFDVPEPCLCGDPCCRRCFAGHAEREVCEDCGRGPREQDPDDALDMERERSRWAPSAPKGEV
jgi:hypothetical protein